MEEQDKTYRNTQKILNKLISEELLAGNFYNGCVASVTPMQRRVIEEKFSEIARDELEDHARVLTKFAIENGFEVPFKYKDIEKYSSKKMVAKFNTLKRGEDAQYYIERAIESEVEAIKSYEECMAGEYLFDLQPVMLKCYYEEMKHLEDLQLLLTCANMGVDLK